MLDTSFLFEQDTINGPTAQYILCSLCFNNYFVVMILNNEMMIWIKNIFKKSFFCQTKGLLHGEKILVQYTYNGKNKKYIYQCNKFLTQVAIYKVLLHMLFVKKTDYRSQLINFLCSSPVHHSHLAKTVYL